MNVCMHVYMKDCLRMHVCMYVPIHVCMDVYSLCEGWTIRYRTRVMQKQAGELADRMSFLCAGHMPHHGIGTISKSVHQHGGSCRMYPLI